MEYASNAKGNLGVTLGAIGTGLGILDGGASMLGKVLGNNSTPEGATVSRYELGLVTDTINEKYMQLAQEATTDKEKIILFDIAKEEMKHKKFLIELLNDMAVK